MFPRTPPTKPPATSTTSTSTTTASTSAPPSATPSRRPSASSTPSERRHLPDRTARHLPYSEFAYSPGVSHASSTPSLLPRPTSALSRPSTPQDLDSAIVSIGDISIPLSGPITTSQVTPTTAAAFSSSSAAAARFSSLQANPAVRQQLFHSPVQSVSAPSLSSFVTTTGSYAALSSNLNVGVSNAPAIAATSVQTGSVPTSVVSSQRPIVSAIQHTGRPRMMAVAHPFSKPVFSDTAKHLDARNFLVRFESYAAAVPWSRDHWHTEVANCLEGEPLRWFYGGLRQTVSIHSPHRNSVQDWDEFKEYFMQAYRPEARHSVRVKTFEALKQKTNETLTNFWHRCGTSINEMFHGDNSPEYVQSSRKITHAVTGASLTIPSAALFDLLCGGEAEFRRKASSPDTLQELMADLYTFVIRLTNESQGIYKNIISKNMLVSGVQSYLKDRPSLRTICRFHNCCRSYESSRVPWACMYTRLLHKKLILTKST